MTKDLEKEFIGKGEVKGLKFTQIDNTPYGFLYKVASNGSSVHYEVFMRKIGAYSGFVSNEKYINYIKYPNANAFGVWAWTFKNLKSAKKKLNELEIKKVRL